MQRNKSVFVPLLFEALRCFNDLRCDGLVNVSEKPTLSLCVRPRLLDLSTSRLDLRRRRIRCRRFLPGVFRSAPGTRNELEFSPVVLKFVLRYFQQLAYLHACNFLRPETAQIDRETFTFFGEVFHPSPYFHSRERFHPPAFDQPLIADLPIVLVCDPCERVENSL